jgi:hypothetical protein
MRPACLSRRHPAICVRHVMVAGVAALPFWHVGAFAASADARSSQDAHVAAADVHAPEPNRPPAYQLLRYDEDWSPLRDPARRTDWLDPLKYIPLGASGNSYLSLGGEARERYEYFHNTQWGRGPQDNGGYWLQRYMVHADAHFGEAFRAFLQLKSGLEDGRNGGPRPTDEDKFDVHQAFFDLKAALDEKDSLTLRVGRQELAYGSSRLISVRESPNVRQSFDGAKLIWKTGDWRIDSFVTRPVATNTGVLDDCAEQANALWGVYAVTPLSWLRGANIDVYYIGLKRDDAQFNQGTADELRHSLGTRLWGRRDNWDYNFEFVYQFGTFGSGDISAWTASSDTGYTFTGSPMDPRLSLKADIISGDRDPANPDLQTFNPLFPRGAYFGETSLIGPANLIDVHPAIEVKPAEEVTVSLDWDFFWRDSNQDGIYGNAVNLVRSSQGSDASYIGNQVQTGLEWQFARHYTFALVYAHFFAGEYLEQTAPGEDVDYVSSWITFKF